MNRFQLWSLVCFLILVLCRIDAFGNGGPWVATDITGSGNLTPAAALDVQLVSEDLMITIDDLESYSVHAQYVLSNPGPAQTVVFGVPLTWWSYFEMAREYDDVIEALDSGLRGGDLQEQLGELTGHLAQVEETAQNLEIELEGETFECVPTDLIGGQRRPFESWNDLIDYDDETLGESWGSFEGVDDSWYESISVSSVRAWCITEMTIASGTNLSLSLRYDAELAFADDYSEFPFSNGVRRLSYLLFPAGYWAGNAARVDITVDLGPFERAQMAVFPPATATDTDELQWHFEDVDLTLLPSLEIWFFVGDRLNQRVVSEWNDRDSDLPRNEMHLWLDLLPSASSVRQREAGSGFEPELLVDGRETTAWCEGVSGSGVGEYVEIHLNAQMSPSFEAPRNDWEDFLPSFGRFGVIPGWAASPHTYRESNRPSQIGLSACGTDSPNLVLTADEVSTAHNEAVVIWRFSDEMEDNIDPEASFDPTEVLQTPFYRLFQQLEAGNDLPSNTAEPDDCVRITLLDVEVGTSGEHTCISEIAFLSPFRSF